MRRVLVAISLAVLAAAPVGARVILVPDVANGILTVQEGMNAAVSGDTVKLAVGVFDSVYTFVTPFGVRTAICELKNGVTLRGSVRRQSVIDHTGAQYGILCRDIGAAARISNLTIRGGVGRDAGREDDGDGRTLAAGIMCWENASPTIENVSINESATGVVVRDGCAPTIRGAVIARGSHHGVYVYRNGTSPVILDHVTAVSNFDNGVYVFQGRAELTSCCVTHSGKPGISAYDCTPSVEYCNVFLNDRTSTGMPEDYAGEIDDLTGQFGNISSEPFYCDFSGAVGYDYHVCMDSPNVDAGQGGTDIGAFGGSCTACVSPVSRTTWGAIKALYR